jgi:hypothetical protein
MRLGKLGAYTVITRAKGPATSGGLRNGEEVSTDRGRTWAVKTALARTQGGAGPGSRAPPACCCSEQAYHHSPVRRRSRRTAGAAAQLPSADCHFCKAIRTRPPLFSSVKKIFYLSHRDSLLYINFSRTHIIFIPYSIPTIPYFIPLTPPSLSPTLSLLLQCLACVHSAPLGIARGAGARTLRVGVVPNSLQDIGRACNTPGVCHSLSSGFELKKNDRLSGDENVKVNLWR